MILRLMVQYKSKISRLYKQCQYGLGIYAILLAINFDLEKGKHLWVQSCASPGQFLRGFQGDPCISGDVKESSLVLVSFHRKFSISYGQLSKRKEKVRLFLQLRQITQTQEEVAILLELTFKYVQLFPKARLPSSLGNKGPRYDTSSQDVYVNNPSISK